MSHDCENKDFIDCGGTGTKPCKSKRDKAKKRKKQDWDGTGP